MQKPITVALLGAGIRGSMAYGIYIKKHPDQIRMVAVAEPDEKRREDVRKMHHIPKENCFLDWKDLLEGKKIADAVIITTQDAMHYEAAICAIDKGYHILMEKPISNNLEECIHLARFARDKQLVFLLCYVMRYSPFYRKIKDLLQQGSIGELVSIRHSENIAYWHYAHSFVRGSWSNLSRSSPLILSKSSHDMDLLLWFAGSDVKSVSSFGDLSFFKQDLAPTGAPKRCSLGCPYQKECPYNATRFYLEEGHYKWAIRAMTTDSSPEGIRKALETGPYGRCVFYCDNDVMDHQLVNIQFQNGVTASYTVSAFTKDFFRKTTLMGTKGEIRANDLSFDIRLSTFGSDKAELFFVDDCDTGHGGGDEGIMKDFIDAIYGEKSLEDLTDIQCSLNSHLLAFEAERSRKERRVVDFEELS